MTDRTSYRLELIFQFTALNWSRAMELVSCLISSVNILFASATAPQETDFTSPFYFFPLNLLRVVWSIFLSSFSFGLISLHDLSGCTQRPQVVFLV